MSADARSLERRRLQTLVEADIAAAVSLPVSNYQLIAPGGQPVPRDEYLGMIGVGNRVRRVRASVRNCGPSGSSLRRVRLATIWNPSLADAAVDAFAQQVGVPAVPGVLLDPVNQQLPNGDTVLP